MGQMNFQEVVQGLLIAGKICGLRELEERWRISKFYDKLDVRKLKINKHNEAKF